MSRSRAPRAPVLRLLVALQVLFLVATFVAPVSATLGADGPSITSDQPDYAPGATVVLTGSGWQVDESVRVSVNDDVGSSWSHAVDVTADDSGTIVDEFTLPDWFVARYAVVATGTSGVATSTFTDGNVNVKTAGTTSAATVTWARYATTNCTGSLTGSPSSGSISVGTSGITGIPGGAGVGQSLLLTVQPIGGFSFVNWTGTGSFTPSTSNPLCFQGVNSTQQLQVNFSAIAATSLAVAAASGTYGGTVNLSATLTAGANGVPGKSIAFILHGAPAGTATTNGSGVASLTGFSLAGIDAGSYTADVTATFSGDASFAASAGSANLAIGAASTSTVVTCPASVTYDGTPQEPCSVTVSGAGGLSLSPNPDYTDNTNAGTASASYTYAGDANHTGSSDTATFAIDKASSTTVVAFEAGPYTYRGTAFTATAQVTGAGGLDSVLAVGYTGDCINVTAPDGCTASAAFSGDANHDPSGDAQSITIGKRAVTGRFTAANKTWDGSPAATVLTRALIGAVPGDDVALSGGTATFASSSLGTWTVTLTGATLTGSTSGNYDLLSVQTTTASISTAFRIVGFFQPVDMTAIGQPRFYNSVKGGQTVPLKFRLYSVSGPEVTDPAGVNVRAMSVTCLTGDVDPTLLPVDATGSTSLRYADGQFIYNWAVPKTAGKCYRLTVEAADGSTVMVATGGTSAQEGYIRSK